MNENLIEIGEILNAIADPVRQEILLFFYNKKKEACVGEIAAQFTLNRSTISHHLLVMKRLKILKMQKTGKRRYYSFNKDYVVEKIEAILTFLKGCC